ncbi:MAG: hypothetical protein HQL68_09575 [Magnetococcales bacterium]|nr:hypothetical protein [Magnetococcales bacterium]
MKKSLILGAAAMAALVAVPQADAADVKIGGYYMMRAVSQDTTLTEDSTLDDTQGWFQRVQLDVDAKVSDKTSAHLHTRILGSSDTIDGANIGNAADANDALDVKRAWMETEVYGVTVKAGNMPLAINDKLLFKDDGGSYGTILLAKNFGGVTAVALNVRADEGTTTGANADTDDANIYGLSLVGKASNLSYQLTWAHLAIEEDYAAYKDSNNNWIALTVGADMGGMNVTGTGIYETGHSQDDETGLADTLTDGGFMGAVRVKGKTGFGGWNAYGFYAAESFNHPAETYTSGRVNQGFSKTWFQGGPGGTVLMESWATGDGGTSNKNNLQNMMGVGVGATVKAGSWTISPAVDYATVVEDAGVNSKSAYGGSLYLTTALDKGATFSLVGLYVKPTDDSSTVDYAAMQALQAEFKVKF